MKLCGAAVCIAVCLLSGNLGTVLSQGTSITSTQAQATPASQATVTAATQPPPTIAAAAPPPPAAVIKLSGTYLTTKDQANGPTLIIDETGKEVIFHGLGWYGFNTGGTAPLDLTKGLNAISQDLDQVVYRMKMLGFNSVRLPMTFDSTWGLGQSPPTTLTRQCIVPSEADIEKSLIPPSYPDLPLAASNQLPQSPPEVIGGICNANMPTDSTLARYIWVVQQFIEQGFYVNVDYHSSAYTDQLAHGDGSIYNQETWTAAWVQLVETILQAVPAAQGKLLLDLINEPDSFKLKWEAYGSYPGATDLYIKTMDALYPVCPGCIFLIEGTGQYGYCGVNWGSGYATNAAIIAQNDISDATPFFKAILTKPYLDQVVLAPHFYCPGVSGASSCYSGQTQWTAYDNVVGYLTRSPGFCSGGNCKVFNAIVDEFGSTLNTTIETTCMASIIAYMNVGNTGKHAPLTSWFYWAWQPDSNGTGGMVEDDWMTIRWDKVNSLSGGTKSWPQGVGLSPWYTAAYNKTAPTFAMNNTIGGPLTVNLASREISTTPALPAAATPETGPTLEQYVAATQAAEASGIVATGG